MIKTWICAKLAECFEVHKTDKQRKIEEAVANARACAKQLNESLASLAKLSGHCTWVRFKKNRWSDIESSFDCSLRVVEIRSELIGDKRSI